MPPRRWTHVPPTPPNNAEDYFNRERWDNSEVRVLVYYLFEWAKDHPRYDQRILPQLVEDVSFNMTLHLFREYSTHKIMTKICHLRAYYVGFKKFIKTPGVSYNDHINEVSVTSAYLAANPNETRKQMRYRTIGCPFYGDLHFIFRKKRCPLFTVELQFYPGDWLEGVSDSSDEECLDEDSEHDEEH